MGVKPEPRWISTSKHNSFAADVIVMERDESSLRAPKHGKARGKPVRMTRPGRQILWGRLNFGEGKVLL